MAKVPAKKAANTEVVVAPTDEFADYAGAGMEGVTSRDLLIPRITILQSLSPQIKKTKVEYIEGAEEGDICEVATGEIFKAPLLFLPCLYKKQYLEWAPRSSGTGLVNMHDDPSILERCTQDEKGRPVLANGNYIGETAQWFGLNLSHSSRQPCFIPMASTQLRKARKWMTMAMGEKIRSGDREFTPPLFYRSYELGVGDESNNDGDWKGWVINRGPALPELDMGIDWRQIKEEAVAFRESLMSGQARGDLSGIDGGPAAGGSDDTDEVAM